jgi:hypothetical protein
MNKILVCCLLMVGVAHGQKCPDPSLLKRELVDKLVDTRNAALLSPAAWRKMRWAPGHGKKLAGNFWTTPEVAIKAVLAVEARNPLVIPEPFRAQVAAAPRDANLRLQMAECELKSPATRRRAAHDAALAVLLGAPASKASDLIVTGAKAEFDRFFCNANMPCNGGAVCERKDNRCLGAADRAFSFVSIDEILIEDALSRALLKHFVIRRGIEIDEEAARKWAYAMRHRCGGQICQALYEGEGNLTVWDIRDGGKAEDHVRTAPRTASRSACLMHTEQTNYDACIDSCRRPTGTGTFISSEGCTLRCEKYCL